MNRVKKLIEGYPDLVKRKQLLHNRLFSMSGNTPLQEESLLMRLDDLEQQEELILDMVYRADSLSDRDTAMLDMRLWGMTLDEMCQQFGLTSREGANTALKKAYKKIATEYQNSLGR